ncbi:DE-cadherin-like isoform X2 [Aphidius gifuensis]|nr:DE-cadherin-like isoform X2 [Aphidius gifuensis]
MLTHSKNSEPRVELLQADETLINNYNQNNKPVFTNCNNYHPSMNEGERPGYPVIQVQAVDPDPIDQGGKITYSLLNKQVDEELGFEINNKTGWISTTETKPTSRKEAWLTVVATDNGYYPSSSECSFKITIKKKYSFDKMK